MPNNKRNISFKKKNKRGGRRNGSIGVKVTPIHGIEKALNKKGVYKAVLKASSNNIENGKSEYYELNHNGTTIHKTTNTEVELLKELSNKIEKEEAATKIQALARGKRDRKSLSDFKKKLKERREAATKIQAQVRRIQEENLKKAADTFYDEILKKFEDKQFVSKFTGNKRVLDLLEIKPTNEDNKETFETFKHELKHYEKRIKQNYIKKYKESKKLHMDENNKINEKINEALQEAEKQHIAATKIQALARRRSKQRAEQLAAEEARRKAAEQLAAEEKAAEEARRKDIEEERKAAESKLNQRLKEQRTPEKQELYKTQYALVEYIRKEIYGKPNNGVSSNLRNVGKLKQFLESSYVQENLLKYYPEFQQTLNDILESEGKDFEIMNIDPNDPEKKLTTEGSETPYRKVIEEIKNNLSLTGKKKEKKNELIKIYNERKEGIINIIGPQSLPPIRAPAGTRVINVKGPKQNIDNTRINKIRNLLLNGQFLNNDEDIKFLKELGIKIDDNYKPESLANEIDEQIRKLNGNFIGNFTGGSRKPKKKQKRKGKLPKHLRNTRRRKSYHKKRQLKTKNTRTRKFKK